LTLNIWTPNPPAAARLPVMVWFHGGGNHSGSSIGGSTAGGFAYDGERFAEKGAIFVSFNYRIGVVGFLAHPALDAESANHVSGNYGLFDQIQALKWIQKNIAAFGGDPSMVTVMGSSAGSTDITALIASPLATGLFAMATLDSLVEGGVLPSLAQFEQGTGARVVLATGCSGDNTAIAACLRALPASALVAAVPGTIDLFPRIYTPNVDGHLLTASPIDIIKSGNHEHMPIILGSNGAETALQTASAGMIVDDASYRAAITKVFGAAKLNAIVTQYPSAGATTPKAAFVALSTDALHLCASRRLARAFAAGQKEPLYRFLYMHAFDNDATLHAAGPAHVFEVPFLFGFSHAATYKPSAGEQALADAMLGYWTRFAGAGDPNGGGAVAWPKYSGSADSYLTLDATMAPGSGIRTAMCDFWDAL
jgi:para-nitrobenzyl esterase